MDIMVYLVRGNNYVLLTVLGLLSSHSIRILAFALCSVLAVLNLNFSEI